MWPSQCPKPVLVPFTGQVFSIGAWSGTAQPMAVAPKCFPDAPRFWPLPLPSITNRKGSVIREPWPCPEEAGARVREGQVLAPRTSGRRGTHGMFSPWPHLPLLSLCRCSPATPILGKGEMDTYLVVMGFEFSSCKVLPGKMSD